MQALEYAKSLIAFPSISRRSNQPVSQWVADRLTQMGFEIEWLTFVDDLGETKVNVVAKREPIRSGASSDGVAYLCHTDVVPADDWSLQESGPFEPRVIDDRLYGRGACDMKGSLACALAAAETVPIQKQMGPLYFVCTADEEVGTVGARQVRDQSKIFQQMRETETIGLVGEPTRLQVIHSHKGGFGIELTSRGISAHSSTRDGINANHRLIPILPMLLEIQRECEQRRDLQNPLFDPPTLSWNIVLSNQPRAMNITPSTAKAKVFFRPMPGVDHGSLVRRVQEEAERLGLEIHLIDSTPAFHVDEDSEAVHFMLELTGNKAAGTVCYTTDGGILQSLPHMVVCGPGDLAQAHRSDEYIELGQLQAGTETYRRAFQEWATWSLAPEKAALLGRRRKMAWPSADEDARGDARLGAKADFQIRPSTPADLSAVQGFLQGFVEQKKLLRRTRAELATLITNGFIAEVDGRIVGFSAIEVYSRKLAEVQCLAVSSGFQGQGIGGQLVRRCVERAREKGILEVMAISASDGFLRHLGFDYSLPDQKRALFYQLRSREEMYGQSSEDE